MIVAQHSEADTTHIIWKSSWWWFNEVFWSIFSSTVTTLDAQCLTCNWSGQDCLLIHQPLYPP